jgi:hypothetical protein
MCKVVPGGISVGTGGQVSQIQSRVYSDLRQTSFPSVEHQLYVTGRVHCAT